MSVYLKIIFLFKKRKITLLSTPIKIAHGLYIYIYITFVKLPHVHHNDMVITLSATSETGSKRVVHLWFLELYVFSSQKKICLHYIILNARNVPDYRFL